jgi:hypothetical protein
MYVVDHGDGYYSLITPLDELIRKEVGEGS